MACDFSCIRSAVTAAHVRSILVVRAWHVYNAGLSVMLHIDSWAPYNASEGFSQANMRHAKFVTHSDNRWLFVDRTSMADTAL